MRKNTKITFLFWGAILCFISAALPDAAEASPESTHCTPHYSGEHIDGWISDGLHLAGLPDDLARHNALKAQAWQESRYIPTIVNTHDLNYLLGKPSVGLEQVEPTTYSNTRTGKTYPFQPCATDPVVSVAVRAELFEQGWDH